MTQKNFDPHCKSLTKKGNPCRAAATKGGLCFFHANPNKASELGRIGGRSKRFSVGENSDPLPTLDNATAVRDTVARLITDTYAGKLHPRMAARLAPLLSLQLRVIETTELERRMVRIEKLLEKSETEADAGANAHATPGEDLKETGESRPQRLDPEA